MNSINSTDKSKKRKPESGGAVYISHGLDLSRKGKKIKRSIEQITVGSSFASDRIFFVNMLDQNNMSLNQQITNKNTKPHSLAEAVIQGRGYCAEGRESLQTKNYFVDPTKENIAAYNSVLIRAVQSNEVSLLRKLRNAGHPMHACNQFGESVLHMACRRGFTEIVRFFLTEANVSCKLRDDFGRTPLHDAFWSHKPNFCIVDMILDMEPELLLLKDKRGFMPLEYVRMEHWSKWNNFIDEREAKLIHRKDYSSII